MIRIIETINLTIDMPVYPYNTMWMKC